MSAIPESSLTLTFIVSSIIVAVLSSLGTILVQTYVNNKTKEKERTIEQIEYTKANVYSPLLFHLFKVMDYLAVIAGNLRGFAEVDFSNKEQQENLISILKEETNRFGCNSVRELLSDKIAFIKPPEFRRELFFYFQTLNLYEKKIREFVKTGFFENTIEKDIIYIKNLETASIELINKTEVFEFYFDNSIDNGGKTVKGLKVFSKEDLKTLTAQFLGNRSKPSFVINF